MSSVRVRFHLCKCNDITLAMLDPTKHITEVTVVNGARVKDVLNEVLEKLRVPAKETFGIRYHVQGNCSHAKPIAKLIGFRADVNIFLHVAFRINSARRWKEMEVGEANRVRAVIIFRDAREGGTSIPAIHKSYSGKTVLKELPRLIRGRVDETLRYIAPCRPRHRTRYTTKICWKNQRAIRVDILNIKRLSDLFPEPGHPANTISVLITIEHEYDAAITSTFEINKITHIDYIRMGESNMQKCCSGIARSSTIGDDADASFPSGTDALIGCYRSIPKSPLKRFEIFHASLLEVDGETYFASIPEIPQQVSNLNASSLVFDSPFTDAGSDLQKLEVAFLKAPKQDMTGDKKPVRACLTFNNFRSPWKQESRIKPDHYDAAIRIVHKMCSIASHKEELTYGITERFDAVGDVAADIRLRVQSLIYNPHAQASSPQSACACTLGPPGAPNYDIDLWVMPQPPAPQKLYRWTTGTEELCDLAGFLNPVLMEEQFNARMYMEAHVRPKTGDVLEVATLPFN